MHASAEPLAAQDAALSGQIQPGGSLSPTQQDRRALQMMVEYVRAETRADGCAAALSNGSEVLAQAGSGVAPQIGAVLHPHAGLSGECLRTGVVVNCGDTGSDPRTDPEACRQMGIASVLVVPVSVEGRTVGILEVFSGRCGNFLKRDVAVMRRVAEAIAALICPNGVF